MRDPQEAAAARAREMLEGVQPPNAEADEAPEAEADEAIGRVSGPEPVAEAEAQQEAEETETFELPDFNPKIPEDLVEELEMPDFDDDSEESASEEDEEEDEQYEDDDPRVEEMRAKLRAAERRAAWLEQKRATDKRKDWEKEAIQYLPLSTYAFSSIQATSRRGFLREAKKAHDAVLPVINQYAEAYAKQHEALKKQIAEEAYADAGRAWGKPTVQPSPQEMTTESARRERLGGARDLEQRVKARLFPDG